MLLQPVPSAAQPSQELRGVWITNVASTLMNSDASIAQAMDYLASAGFNVVFPVVWNGGYTLYPSDVMSRTFGTPIHPSFTGRDPLARIIVEAHRRGMEVIPWFEYGLAGYYASDSSYLGTILSARPAWVLRDAAGRVATKNGTFPQFVWMSGLHPEVQNFMISLVTEVIDRYDVDGVQGDDRLPAMPVEGGYESSTIAQYQAEHGGALPPSDYRNAAWMRWRADKLTDFLRRMRDSVKARRSHLVFSTGPSEYAWGYPEYLQDSKTWVDSAIVDNFIPQLYPTNRATPQETINDYTFRLDRALGVVPTVRRPMFFAGVLARVGSYQIEPATATSIVALNRARGVQGETYFFYEGIRANSNAVGEALRTGPYQTPATLPYRNGTAFRPPAIIVNESDTTATRTGSWLRFNVSGFNGVGLVAFDTGAVKSIVYRASVPERAFYDVFAYRIVSPSAARTAVAPFDLYDRNGRTTRVTLDQTVSGASGWVWLGSVELDAGERDVVRLSNEGIGSGKTVVADAVMIMVNRALAPTTPTAVVEPAGSAETPRAFTIHGAYPNPFNPSTVIRVELGTSAPVRLEVFDLLGRSVAVLVDGTLSAGQHDIRWTADAPSGTYLVRMTSRDQSQAGLAPSSVVRVMLIR
jgi:uncharacterized lipoprotein YddW (UPF0748 family)